MDLFARADMILFAAVGNTNAVAIDAAIKFGQLGLRSVATTITESSTSLALSMRKGDVLFLISNSGKSKRLEKYFMLRSKAAPRRSSSPATPPLPSPACQT